MMSDTSTAQVKFLEKMEYLKSQGIDVETKLLMSVGPDDAKVFMKQFEVLFVSGFASGMEHTFNLLGTKIGTKK